MTTRITTDNITDGTIAAADLSNLPNLIDWQAVVTADGSTNTTAEAGKGYFIDTTSATHTITLPSSPSLGDTIVVVDYASKFGTNNVTLDPNGNKIEASTSNGTLTTTDQTHTIVYTDSTQGWKIVNQDTVSGIQPSFTQATGGTVTESGDFKIHTFNSSGNFVVTTAGNKTDMPASPAAGPNTVSYLVIAGGGSGGVPNTYTGGGGAGGFREGKDAPIDSYTASPLNAPSGLTITAQTYSVTVGAGGASSGANGSDSVFSTITSAGGGRGRYGNGAPEVGSGGSGGGGSGGGPGAAGSGNTPPVSPPQGSNGGGGPTCSPRYGRAGGGGAVDAGSAGSPTSGGEGGDGTTSSISGSSTTYAAGGGGGYYSLGGCSSGARGNGGSGGAIGGAAAPNKVTPATSGNANTGTGGGGATAGGPPGCSAAGSGGSGVVIIRYKYQ